MLSIVDYVDRYFETYVQRRDKLSCYYTLCYKMESIHAKTRMKGQDSRGLVDEANKEDD